MSWPQFCQDNSVALIYHNCNLNNLKSYKLQAMDFLDHPFSILIMGDAGRGKTYFMFTLIRGLLEKGCHRGDLRFINALILDERVEEETKRFGTSHHFVDNLCDNRFLFIDDFGIEKSRDRAERNYYHLLDKRLNNKQPTIISTNLKEEEILAVYGTRIESRLKMCRKIVFTGEDLRTI